MLIVFYELDLYFVPRSSPFYGIKLLKKKKSCSTWNLY